MRYSIVQSYTFHAAHHLPWHAGRCAGVHGHTYSFEIRIEGSRDANGIIVDFDELELIIGKRVLSVLDHTDLNSTFSSPTAENVAAWIFDEVEAEFEGVQSVRLWETPESSAIVER